MLEARIKYYRIALKGLYLHYGISCIFVQKWASGPMWLALVADKTDLTLNV